MLARLGDRLALVALALAALAVIGPALLPGRAFVSISTTERQPLHASLDPEDLETSHRRANQETGDQVFQVIPERVAFFDALRRGELPLWWREAGGGLSILGEPGSEILEPRVFLFTLLFGEVRSQGVLAALSVFVLGALTYLYLRLRELPPLAALGGAIAFALAGPTSANAFYSCKFNAYVLLPGGLAAIELCLRGRRALGVGLLAACAADSALAGFPQNTAVSAYALAGIGVWRALETRRVKSLGWIGAAAALGLAVGAIHWLPMLEVQARSSRPISSGGVGPHLVPAQAIGLFAPLALGDPTSDAAIDPAANPIPALIPSLRDDSVPNASVGFKFTEVAIYAGLAAIPLALAGLARGRRAWIPLVGLLLCGGMAAGPPLALLPGVNAGAPARAIGGASFFLAVLVAEGLAGLSVSRACRVAAAAGAVVLLAFAAIALGLTSLGPAEHAPGRDTPRWLEIFAELRWRGALAVASAAAVGVAIARPKWIALPILVLAADLAQFGLHVVPPRPSRGLFEETPPVRRIRDAAAGGRVARVSDDANDYRLFQTTLPPAYGIADVSAYVVFPDVDQARVAYWFAPESIYSDTYIARFPPLSLSTRVFDVMGVSVVMTPAPVSRPDLEPVIDLAGFHAYRRTRWLGRAWVVPRARVVAERDAALEAVAAPSFDPSREVILDRAEGAPLEALGGGDVSVRDVSNREVAISVRGTKGGFLVEPAPSCAGWSATLDGRPAPLLRANHAFRAVALPPGDHEVRFVYLPASAVRGALASLGALIAIVVVVRRLARAPQAA